MSVCVPHPSRGRAPPHHAPRRGGELCLLEYLTSHTGTKWDYEAFECWGAGGGGGFLLAGWVNGCVIESPWNVL